MVVTDLAARGLDLPFISNVVHYDFPAQAKLFIHRSGRTARANRTGNAYSLISKNEVMFISEIMLYIGRTLSNNIKDLNNNEKALYGSLPSELFSDI